MMRCLVLSALMLGVTTPAQAETVTVRTTFTDMTPDPTNNLYPIGIRNCHGTLPNETPIPFEAPAVGKLKVVLGGFIGDWALEIRDAAGAVLNGIDVLPPDYEQTTIKINSPGTYHVLPCNLAGTVEATVTMVYTRA